MTARKWITAYAATLGVPAPDDAAVEAILDLAGAAAHASERTAAPVACWLAAASGQTPQSALALALALARDAGTARPS